MQFFYLVSLRVYTSHTVERHAIVWWVPKRRNSRQPLYVRVSFPATIVCIYDVPVTPKMNYTPRWRYVSTKIRARIKFDPCKRAAASWENSDGSVEGPSF